MLNYLFESTERLASLMVMAGMLFAYIQIAYQGKARTVMRCGLCFGVISAIAMFIFKTTTSKIDTGFWNLCNYAVSLGALVLFFIFTAFRKRLRKLEMFLPSVMMAVELALLILYFLPAVFEMPHTILFAEETVFSTTFIVKTLGVLFGFLLTFVMGLSIYHGTLCVSEKTALLLVSLVLLVNTFKQVAAAFSIMLAKRIIASNHVLFTISKYTSNLSNWFIYLTLLLAAVVPVVLLVRSFSVSEPYENRAQRRKILGKWRMRKRWSAVSLISFILVVFIMTAVKTYANRTIELSPIENATIENNCVIVPFEQINDGHLHRFGYTSDNGAIIRFIVIQKPNSSAYGIGLDACEICGETGYYEKEGQIVCNLCDVVMNINTIGFKGGCNPIVIDYRIENGSIVVPVEGLLEYESLFK